MRKNGQKGLFFPPFSVFFVHFLKLPQDVFLLFFFILYLFLCIIPFWKMDVSSKNDDNYETEYRVIEKQNISEKKCIRQIKQQG